MLFLQLMYLHRSLQLFGLLDHLRMMGKQCQTFQLDKLCLNIRITLVKRSFKGLFSQWRSA